MERAGKVTGKITAEPNPISFEQGAVVISWETNDPAGAEVRVSTTAADEKLVTRGGTSGHVEIPWIAGAREYRFSLHPVGQPGIAIDSVNVRRDHNLSHPLLRQVAREVADGTISAPMFSRFIAKVLPRCLHSSEFREIFGHWERHGFHVTPVHFYQPIPDTQSLSETLWDRPSELIGIDMNDSAQLDLLRRQFSKFRDECEQLPTEPTETPTRFYLKNGLFGGLDALVAYCMVRHFQPRLIVEIGSGFSSLILGEALRKNNKGSLNCIDPSPPNFLRENPPGLHALIEKRVQDIDVDFFSRLNPGDILFVDSSHTVKIGGDVNYLFLEVLPRLKPGIIVHIHDIFLPFDYRRDWVMEQFRFWTEQYLLQAFLMFNSEFEVLMANSYLNHCHPEELKATFPPLPSWRGGSFWIQRRTAKAD
jgi:hypothetical protein